MCNQKQLKFQIFNLFFQAFVNKYYGPTPRCTNFYVAKSCYSLKLQSYK